MKHLIAIGLVAAFVVPLALASHPTVQSVAVGSDIYYVGLGASSPHDDGVWKETNTCPGLQHVVSDCDDDNIDEPADEKVL